jgi:hypothetical protein
MGRGRRSGVDRRSRGCRSSGGFPVGKSLIVEQSLALNGLLITSNG